MPSRLFIAGAHVVMLGTGVHIKKSVFAEFIQVGRASAAIRADSDIETLGVLGYEGDTAPFQ